MGEVIRSWMLLGGQGHLDDFLKLAALIQFNHNVGTAQKLAIDVHLGNRRPLAKCLDPFS